MRALVILIALAGCQMSLPTSGALCSLTGPDRAAMIASLHSTDADFALACLLAPK